MKNNCPKGILERRLLSSERTRWREIGATPFASLRRHEEKAFGSTQKEHEIKYLVDYNDWIPPPPRVGGWRIESGMIHAKINNKYY